MNKHHLVQAEVRPLDEDGVQVARVGTLLFALMTLVMWLRLDQLRADGEDWWLWTGVAGMVLGLVGLLWCTRRRARRAGTAG